MNSLRAARGFTLIELIIVMLVLAVISIGISQFVKVSSDVFMDVTEREALLRDGSFAMERLNRELTGAVPNSARVSGNAAVHCLQFVPQVWSGFYLELPQQPSSDTQVALLNMPGLNGAAYVPNIDKDFAIVYPTQASHVYDPSFQHRQAVQACSDDGDGDCATFDDADHIVEIDVEDAFARSSPAKRLYIANHSVSYCVRAGGLYRYEDNITTSQALYTSGGVLMAQNLANSLSTAVNSPLPNNQNPFAVVDASLQRNAYTQILLLFQRGDEVLSFSQEVHVPNVP